MSFIGHPDTGIQAHSRVPLVVVLARLVAVACVLGAIGLNLGHAVSASSPSILTTAATALLFAGVALGGAISGHLVVTARGFLGKALAATGFIIALVVSVVVSIGSQSATRSDTATKRNSDAADRGSLTSQRKALLDELATLTSTRSEPQIRMAMSKVEIDAITLRRTNHCTNVTREDSRKICQPLIDLHNENAAAQKRSELTKQVGDLDTKLKASNSAGEGDPQSANIAWLATTLGWKLDADTVGRALSILLSAAIEAFAALSAGLAAVAERASRQKEADNASTIVHAPQLSPAPQVAPPALTIQSRARAEALTADTRIVTALHARGGSHVGSQRELGDLVGVTKTTAHAALKRLEAAGAVRLSAGKVELVVKTGLRVIS